MYVKIMLIDPFLIDIVVHIRTEY